jgi:hypothetical protein
MNIRSSKMSFLFTIAVMLTMLMQGCAAVDGAMYNPAVEPPLGAVWSVQNGTTIWGIQRALQGAVGSMIWYDPVKSNFAIMWPLKDQGLAFYLMNLKTMQFVTDTSVASDIIGKANLVNCKDAAGIIDVMKKHGWELISAERIGEVLATGGQSIIDAASTATTTLPTFTLMWSESVMSIDEMFEIIAPGYSGIDT